MDTEELIRILAGVDDNEVVYINSSDCETESEREEEVTEESQGNSSSETQFQWTGLPNTMDNQAFNDFSSGILPSLQLSPSSSELEYLEKFVDELLVSKIVYYTNRYHRHFVLNTDLRNHSRLQAWQDVTISDIYIFLAVTMLMSRNSRINIEEHWSTNPLLNSPIFTTLMSRNRYTTLLGMLHFSEPGPQQPRDSILHKIKGIVDDARCKFQDYFIPYQKLCIDESMVPFKGRLSIKQCLPNKRNRFGIKLFVLCDVSTKIILDFIIYTGNETEIVRNTDLGISGSLVTTLVQRYYFTNRNIYMNNWYSSPKLFNYLKCHGIGACGTVRKNRKAMPVFKKLKKGERDAKYTSNIMALKWHDKKDVHMLTTFHEDRLGPSEKIDRSTSLPVMKSECILDYNKNMGIVDTNDMMLSSINCMRKTVKWYKKLFFHIIDMHLLNSFYYCKVLKNNSSLYYHNFQLSVIKQIVVKYAGGRSLPMTNRAFENPARLLGDNTAKHMPAYLPQQKKLRCKLCAHVYRKRRDSRFWCEECKIPLCVTCFRPYYEKKKYKFLSQFSIFLKLPYSYNLPSCTYNLY